MGQQKTRGMVNGNVLVPLPSERTPLATDPALRAFVLLILNAYPNQVPNRTDIDPRMLNTNSPRRVDGQDWNTRFEQKIGKPRPAGVSVPPHRPEGDRVSNS